MAKPCFSFMAGKERSAACRGNAQLRTTSGSPFIPLPRSLLKARKDSICSGISTAVSAHASAKFDNAWVQELSSSLPALP